MKWDLDSHTSSRSLTHPAGNLNNKPAARNDHTAQPETEPALNRFALKPLALGQGMRKPDGSPSGFRRGYGLTTRLKVPPKALIPLPLPTGAPPPFGSGASSSWLNR
jgi:hypothetical protein